ncbi:hypothetical protein ILUMI_21602 [Ignelater luminosus]|uniref:Uncharacterized protein n=1 Tax=Ignelater luminosus TaxID=2038154 RepID=A0A8K0G3P9_IGNLU|nr:hypothetical protein ILUMI_21602 [Ignelater luminosus]
MMWKVVEKQIPYLTRSLRNLDRENKEETRAEFCLKTLQEKFSPNPIAVLRDRKYLSNKQRNYQRKLMGDMKIGFIKKLEKAHWMNEKEKDAVVKRAKEIKIRIGEHENYFDDTILNDLNVDMVKPRSESFLGLLAQATRNHQTSRFKLLEELTLEDPINDKAGIPYYHEKSNSIIVPTIAVDGFFWADDRIPNYLNYAKSAGFAFTEFLGSISKNGYAGENHNFSGFSNETTKIIMDTIACLLIQSKNDTLNDNQLQVQYMVLQMFGEQIAHAVYQNWEAHNKKEPRLIGLDYSPLQLFWIASTNCHIVKEGSSGVFEELQTPKYINQRSRMNNPDFAKDFNCALGTKMNPVHKCKFL